MNTIAKSGKYWVLVTVSLGTVLSGYVGSAINIALPNIMQVFGFTMDSVIWVSLSYMLPYGSTLPITGKFGDLLGRKKMYILGLGVFTVATMLIGIAWNSTMLIIFRIVQGVCAGLLLPNAMALVSEAFPANERGQALGMWGALAASGSAFGPTIGGYLIEYVDWRLIFFSIIPVALVGMLLAFKVLTESGEGDKSARIDYLGGALLISGLSFLLMALNQGNKEGWTSPYILGLSAAAFLSMAAFILVEGYVEHPVVDLSLFRNFTFTVSNCVGFLSFMAMYGGLFLLPFYLRNIQGFSAIKAGVSMLPLTISMVLLAPLGGRLADRFGSKIPASLGMMTMALSLFAFRLLDDRTPYFFIAMGLVTMGVGLALTMSPLSNGVMGSLPREKMGVGSGVFNLFKNVGGSVGIAAMGTLLDIRQVFHQAVYNNYLATASIEATRMLATLQGVLMQKGYSVGEAKAGALVLMNAMAAKRASVLAFDDVFLITALLCALGVLPALFIRDAKKRRHAPQSQPETQLEPAAEATAQQTNVPKPVPAT